MNRRQWRQGESRPAMLYLKTAGKARPINGIHNGTHEPITFNEQSRPNDDIGEFRYNIGDLIIPRRTEQLRITSRIQNTDGNNYLFSDGNTFSEAGVDQLISSGAWEYIGAEVE